MDWIPNNRTESPKTVAHDVRDDGTVVAARKKSEARCETGNLKIFGD